MENCNYDRMEMMVYNMVRQGLFGEVLHAEGGYLHDLRSIKFADKGEGLWRRAWATKVNGNLYPTHGLGPVANCLDINRGDRFDYLVSMSGPSRGLQDWAAEHVPADSPKRAGAVRARRRQRQPDQDRAAARRSSSQHCTNLPRPVQPHPHGAGHEGPVPGLSEPRSTSKDAARRISGRRPRTSLARVRASALEGDRRRSAQGAGHGGMDFIEDYRLIKCLREGQPTDMNVYDAAALSAVVELSAQSVAPSSAPLDFPDFTRGRWKTNPPLDIVHM